MTDFWSDARVAEEARLESVYASKAHRGFESPSLRQESLGMRTIGFVIGLPLSQKESPSLRQESLGMRGDKINKCGRCHGSGRCRQCHGQEK